MESSNVIRLLGASTHMPWVVLTPELPHVPTISKHFPRPVPRNLLRWHFEASNPDLAIQLSVNCVSLTDSLLAGRCL